MRFKIRKYKFETIVNIYEMPTGQEKKAGNLKKSPKGNFNHSEWVY